MPVVHESHVESAFPLGVGCRHHRCDDRDHAPELDADPGQIVVAGDGEAAGVAAEAVCVRRKTRWRAIRAPDPGWLFQLGISAAPQGGQS